MKRAELYAMLGLVPGAGEADVAVAYRERVFLCHPDVNPNDPAARDNFLKLTRARDVILRDVRGRESQPGRRAPMARNEVPAARPAAHVVMSSVSPVPVEQKDLLVVSVDLDFEVAARGTDLRFRLRGNRSASVRVPEGSVNGTLVKRMIADSNGTPKEITFEVRVEPHPRYRVRGADLLVRVRWSDRQVMAGDVLHVKTPFEVVPVTVRRYTQRGEIIRVPGRGLPTPLGRGDLRIELAESDKAVGTSRL